jgi:hypothetical protein
LNPGCDYFTRGEGSQNFTFGGKAVEERAPRDEDDEESDEGLAYLLDFIFIY